VAGAAASPHVTAHSELPVHVVRQSPLHFTVHAVESVQVTRLIAPTSILHVALALHVTADEAPSFTSQVELSAHVALLLSPPTPLHCEESAHVRASSCSDVASHFALLEHVSAQSSSPQVVLQSAPATHAHAMPEHVQPVPVHVGSESLPPHAAPSKPIASIHVRMVPSPYSDQPAPLRTGSK
jgi:hypothetical protein